MCPHLLSLCAQACASCSNKVCRCIYGNDHKYHTCDFFTGLVCIRRRKPPQQTHSACSSISSLGSCKSQFFFCVFFSPQPNDAEEADPTEDSTCNTCALCWAPVAHPCLWSPSHGGCAASMAPIPPACTRPVGRRTLPSLCAPSTITLTSTCARAACTASSVSSSTLAAACWPLCSGWRSPPSSFYSTSACAYFCGCSTSCPSSCCCWGTGAWTLGSSMTWSSTACRSPCFWWEGLAGASWCLWTCSCSVSSVGNVVSDVDASHCNFIHRL